MLLLRAGSLSLQLLDAFDFGIWCWIFGKPTLQLDLDVGLCRGSALFDDARDCLAWWWFDEEYCDGEVLLWRWFEATPLVSG
ncbi:hypothetical protein P8452_48433 [Trifolium repens]|nr:hypothetical protein P8452_48433 [Trifolium repens]